MIEGRRKEKSTKFLSGLKSRKGKKYLQSQSSERHIELLDTIRMQMQASCDVFFCILFVFNCECVLSSFYGLLLCLVKFFSAFCLLHLVCAWTI